MAELDSSRWIHASAIRIYYYYETPFIISTRDSSYKFTPHINCRTFYANIRWLGPPGPDVRWPPGPGPGAVTEFQVSSWKVDGLDRGRSSGTAGESATAARAALPVARRQVKPEPPSPSTVTCDMRCRRWFKFVRVVSPWLKNSRERTF